MEGIYFYVFTWCGWIIATFWMKRDATRLYTAVGFLCVIISSMFHFSVRTLQFSGSYIVITIIAILLLYQISWWRTVYLILCAGIVALLYTTLQLMALYDPIWFASSQVWVSSGIISLLIFLIVQIYVEKIIVLCIGIMQGEILLAVVLQPLDVHNEIPSLFSLDILMCALVIVSMVTIVGKSISYVQPFKQKHIREGKGSL